MIPALVSGIATSSTAVAAFATPVGSLPNQSLIVMLLESVVYTGDGASLRQANRGAYTTGFRLVREEESAN